VHFEPCPRRLRVAFAGQTIADTTRSQYLFETAHIPVYYFPRADLHMDLAAYRVTRNGRPIQLGPREYTLLRHLMEHPGRVFSREQLLNAVWGQDIFVEPRTVDVHIRRLRKVLNGVGEIDLIRTVRLAGYALDTE